MCSSRPVAVLVGSIWDEDLVLDAAAYEDVPDEAADSTTEHKGAAALAFCQLASRATRGRTFTHSASLQVAFSILSFRMAR